MNKYEYVKEWRKRNPLKQSEYDKRYKSKDPKKYIARVSKSVEEWRKRNPLGKIAHRTVFVELRAGRLIKERCPCGETKVEAHHEDYSKPLEITWLCKQHHTLRHCIKRNTETPYVPNEREALSYKTIT